MALILDESKDMPAYCKPYYYIRNPANVKEKFRFFYFAPKKFICKSKCNPAIAFSLTNLSVAFTRTNAGVGFITR